MINLTHLVSLIFLFSTPLLGQTANQQRLAPQEEEFSLTMPGPARHGLRSFKFANDSFRLARLYSTDSEALFFGVLGFKKSDTERKMAPNSSSAFYEQWVQWLNTQSFVGQNLEILTNKSDTTPRQFSFRLGPFIGRGNLYETKDHFYIVMATTSDADFPASVADALHSFIVAPENKHADPVVHEADVPTNPSPTPNKVRLIPDVWGRPLAPISGGVLNGKATSLPKPEYPAQAGGKSGVVSVAVLVNEAGKIIKAKAIRGEEVFFQAATEAALRAKLSPTRLSGQLVRVTGVLNYSFVGR